MTKKMLLVEDNEEVRRQLRWAFSDEGYSVIQAENADEAIAIQRKERPQVVTLDLGLPPDAGGSSEGYRCLGALLENDSRCRVIVVTGHHDLDNALRCIQGGAYDFCRKPVDLEELKVIIRRGFFLYELTTSQKEEPVTTGEHGIVSECSQMQDILRNIAKIAASDVPVLITGESGTGKELAARAIHQMSGRKNGPMVSINCGAIPEHLLETEFFGHEKGAFTGALQRVQGKAEYADGGTFFLDEIGELPLLMQVKLLRFLQEMVFQRVGGRQDISVNTRIIASTNRDLIAMVKAGQFREDLYYRIGVVYVTLPPLRERGKDVLQLARHFINKYDETKKIKGLHASAERALQLYPWPGNIRELENKIRRAIIFSDDSLIRLDSLELNPSTTSQNIEDEPVQQSLQEARNNVERKLVLEALSRHSGNIMQASQSIGVSRPTFYDLLKKHKIEA